MACGESNKNNNNSFKGLFFPFNKKNKTTSTFNDDLVCVLKEEKKKERKVNNKFYTLHRNVQRSKLFQNGFLCCRFYCF